ncbi:ATP-binding cassette domain-containing protein [Eggerthellaceae bacterium zg-1084]|uniref:sulfate/molybdate ABC transporter ATP-binding protein n=1 Tax=Berryella wangjianweii TaxID=2734634 RepID=UPI00155577EA|nr:ATP-binding cassette domain-containing protein [Berryella wangjianweii]NPD31649.1 ATP-binding cassette domain-containing protein [Berryella wangjianweii]
MGIVVDIRKRLESFDLRVSFEAGDETVALLGESGCGKSMTLRCIAGIETPDAGRIVVNGVTYFDAERGIDLSPQKRKTALLFQSYELFPHMTVADNIAAGLVGESAEVRRARVGRELERFGLAELSGRYPLQLSGGQQQRVALARMLAAEPPVLMLDEPFSALDAHLKAGLEQSLSVLFREFSGTVLYVSHDIDEAVRLSDRIAVVERGRVRDFCPAAQLIDRPRSVAALKLSGCKNIFAVEPAGSFQVRIPAWGIELNCGDEVPEGANAAGVRAFRLERADGPGSNAVRVRVAHAIDARFDRTYLLDLVASGPDAADASPTGDAAPVPGATPTVNANQAAGTVPAGARATGSEDQRSSEEASPARSGAWRENRLVWRVSTLSSDEEDLPQVGDELWLRIPPEHLYVVAEGPVAPAR